LILLGASVRAAAFSAVRAGYQPYSIDLFADRDLAAIGPAVKIGRYPADFFAALAKAPPAHLIYTGGLENHPRVVDQLAALRPLLGNRGDVLCEVRDPLQLARVVREDGCCFPATSFEGTIASPSQWLVKPLRSSGGVAIRLATADDRLRSPRGAYLQQYVEGESLSAVFVGAGGRAILLGLTKQLLGRDVGHTRPFLYVGSVGPLSFSEGDRAPIESLGNRLAERFRLVGLFNVDLVRNEAGIWPLEVNPRYSASVEVLERATEMTFIKLHIDACERMKLPGAGSMKSRRCSGKAVVYAPQDGVFSKKLDDLASEWNMSRESPGVADLPQVGEPLQRGQPVVTVFADSDSPGSVEAELRSRVATVERLWADS
jgi:predicted ATP-grasp superfamily ATP-dependent carboligase